MRTPHEWLAITEHRPFPLPEGRWKYYQQWNNALFLHWKVEEACLRHLIPPQLNIHKVDGDAYVSMVAFRMEQIRPRGLPALRWISDFDELNIRTYVEKGGKTGVYFLRIEAAKAQSVWVANRLSGLPYQQAAFTVSGSCYVVENRAKGSFVRADFQVGKRLAHKGTLDQGLTERYCLFLEQNRQLYRYDIHHREWPVHEATLTGLALDYPLGPLRLSGTPDLVRYSPGVEVLAWPRVHLEGECAC